MENTSLIYFRSFLPRIIIIKSNLLHSLIIEQSSNQKGDPICTARFQPSSTILWTEYQPLIKTPIIGLLGLLQVENDVFIGFITESLKIAKIESNAIHRILNVKFISISKSTFDSIEKTADETQFLHPCDALIKLLSNGSFYYSHSYNLTLSTQKRYLQLQSLNKLGIPSNRNESSKTEFLNGLSVSDTNFVWNAFMLKPLFKIMDQQLDQLQRSNIDQSGIIVNVSCGFIRSNQFRYKGENYEMMILSRVSSKRAGARFLARGIDDLGNVSNFVETELIIRYSGTTFSFLQVRGSVPAFWEQNGIQVTHKIDITRGSEATIPAAKKHFEDLIERYNQIHVVNLLKQDLNSNEYALSEAYRSCTTAMKELRDVVVFQCFDFHAIIGRENYGRLILLTGPLEKAFEDYGFFLYDHDLNVIVKTQNGVFRTNCLDCLDRTNVVQCALSKTVVDTMLKSIHVNTSSEGYVNAFNGLWADNGDILSYIYAGTGALKSSYTRKGKTSILGYLDDAAKSMNRFVISNFQDKSRQDAIDLLLGKIKPRVPISIQNPISETVAFELRKKCKLFESIESINIFVGSFNVNGKSPTQSNLEAWLSSKKSPALYVIGIQELVQLTAENIVVGDTLSIRQVWESHLIKTLYKINAASGYQYLVLRSVNLVALAMFVFLRTDHVEHVTRVEVATKKTGMGGLTGNKGGIATRLNFYDTTLVFVTAHFAAGQSNIEDRNRDYKTLHEGLKFTGKYIEDHDQVFWFGDFNYRINLSNEEIRNRIEKKQYDQLLGYDQLMEQKDNDISFPEFREGPINFAPTYKYNNGSDTYDTSEKMRAPAWTDRILFKGESINLLLYGREELTLSDHKPVKAIFQSSIMNINHEKRNELQTDIYKRIMLEASSLSNGLLTKPFLPPRPQLVGRLIDLHISDSNLDDTLTSDTTIDMIKPSSTYDKWWDHPIDEERLIKQGDEMNPFFGKEAQENYDNSLR